MSGFLNDVGLDQVEADPNYIPDGPYPVKVTKSEIVAKKSDPDAKSWVITYTIQEGRYAGKSQSEWFQLNPVGDNSELKKSFLKRRVLSLGVPEARVNEVALDYFIGMDAIMTIKHNGQYQNVSDIKLPDRFDAGDSSSNVAPLAGRNQL